MPASSNARRTPISETQAPGPSPGDHRDALAVEAPQRARAVRREDVGAHRRAPVHARKREQRAPGAHHEGRVERGLDELHTLARPAEAEEHVVEVKICATGHTATLGDGRGAAIRATPRDEPGGLPTPLSGR